MRYLIALPVLLLLVLEEKLVRRAARRMAQHQ
jgi:hypothetical protein